MAKHTLFVTAGKRISLRHHLIYVLTFFLFIGFIIPSHPFSNTSSFCSRGNSLVQQAFAAGSCGCVQNPPITYSDVTPGTPYADAVIFMTNNCIFQGYTAAGCTAIGTAWPCFGTTNTIARNEAIFAITRYHLYIRKDWVLQTTDPQYFADYGPSNGQGYYEIQTARHYGFVFGADCSTFYSPNPYPSGSWCIDPFSQWRFGFHGILRTDPQSLTGNYDFNNVSPAISRQVFAQAMYDYYMSADDPTLRLACVPRPGNVPKGNVDDTNCGIVRGWACDPDDYAQPIYVDFYADGPAGTGTYLGRYLAKDNRGPDVAAQCGGNVSHGFVFPLPNTLRNNVNHTIYAYAINIGSGSSNPLLGATDATMEACTPWTPCAGGQDVGGVLLTQPSATVFNGFMLTFVRGSDWAVYVRRTSDGITWSNSGVASWGFWDRVGGVIFDQPRVYTSGGTLYVQVTGTGGIQYITTTTDGITYTPWTAGTAPGVVTTPNQVTFSGYIYTFTRSPYWSMEACRTPIPTYSISGSIVIDSVVANGQLDPGESLYTLPGSTITYSGTRSGSVPVINGNYTLPTLPAGVYNISYTIPLGYKRAYPPPNGGAFYIVNLGPCSISPSGSPANCSASGASNVNIGISDSVKWEQFSGFDMRFDTTYTATIPNTPACSVQSYALAPHDSTKPLVTTGISFVGPGSTFFGGSPFYGKANAHSWVANESYAPANILKTSYTTLLDTARNNGIQLIPLPGRPGCMSYGNCNLNQLNRGVYHATGGILSITSTNNINGNKNIIILSDDSIHIQGKTDVAVGSTLMFIANNDIIIDKTIGSPSNACSTTGDIAGYFSAGRNFKVESQSGVCPVKNDKQLFIEGNVTVNANRVNGKFINDRDLCDDNDRPTVYIKKRLDFLINAPEFLKRQLLDFREVAP